MSRLLARKAAWLLVLGGLLAEPPAWAVVHGRLSVIFVPDPSCRANKLVEVIGPELQAAGRERRLKLVDDAGLARVLVQYFIITRSGPDGVQVEIEGRAFENASGKLLVQQAAASEFHSDDDNGRRDAARQAARDLVELLAPHLVAAYDSRGRGRRVMLQITLDESVVAQADGVVSALLAAGTRVELRGRSARSLVFLLQTKKPARDLSASLAGRLQKIPGLRLDWQLISESTLLLRLSQAAAGKQ